LLEENECELQPSSLASKITGSEHHWTTLVSLETRVRGFPPPPSPPLKQTEDVLQKEWYIIPLETFKTCKSPFQVGFRLYWRQNVVQHRINKEMCTVFVVFP
jgi:hypothetical protein